jgi:hypothetical protein
MNGSPQSGAGLNALLGRTYNGILASHPNLAEMACRSERAKHYLVPTEPAPKSACHLNGLMDKAPGHQSA